MDFISQGSAMPARPQNVSQASRRPESIDDIAESLDIYAARPSLA